MCTAITFKTKQMENLFGRTMDFSYPIEPALYVMPRNYEWNSLVTGEKYINKYGFICLGQETGGMLGLFDGVNEQGFAAAVLYFAGYAYYDLPTESKQQIASLDFLHYILGSCASVDELNSLIKNVNIVGFQDPVTKTIAPLHWIATDRSGKCVVVEQTMEGLKIINNEIGVMANSPDFNWHMTNLRNYMGISTTQKNEANWGNISLAPFGQGGGTVSLPGGFTSPERFVRTAFMKTYTEIPERRYEALMTCFHIMNSVFIPKGVVVTDRGSDDYTKYVSFMNTNTCEYFFKTYENNQIMSASLHDYNLHGTQPIFLGNIVKDISITS